MELYKADYQSEMEQDTRDSAGDSDEEMPTFFLKKEKEDLPWDLPLQVSLPTTRWSSSGRSTGRRGGKE